jgi:hypothetical protein
MGKECGEETESNESTKWKNMRNECEGVFKLEKTEE